MQIPNDVREALSKLGQVPRLNRATQFNKPLRCKICGSKAFLFDVVDFNKYCSIDNYYEYGLSGVPVPYWRCCRCSFVFTNFCDDWSTDDFARFIYNDDYIKVDGEYAEVRPARLAAEWARRLRGCEDVRILDYGSGAGVFADRLRKAGFNAIENYDPFSSPTRPSGKFEIITCFEVIEHSPDPSATFADMASLMADGGFISFSQTVQPTLLPAIRGSWWYLGPRNGHISTFSEETLYIISKQIGFTMHRSSDLYAFTAGALRPPVRNALHTVGPPFATARLFAPPAGPHDFDASRPDEAGWHRVENDDIWAYRWTGLTRLSWFVHWDIAGEIQFRIPFRTDMRPGFAAECKVTLNGLPGKTLVDRNDIVGEFTVSGAGQGLIELHTPPPLPEEDGKGKGIPRELGVAILTKMPDP